jgi:hypothetical protein
MRLALLRPALALPLAAALLLPLAGCSSGSSTGSGSTGGPPKSTQTGKGDSGTATNKKDGDHIPG